ncbi:MAG: GAF domain-containing sensor histidine kinase [Anaerolineae bacterium]|nr:GAF domain-containing sensor histidine kinase [Anaerolineae bacterium]
MADELNQHRKRIFSLLVIYRWASLLPPLWFLFRTPTSINWLWPPGMIFGIAFFGIALITLFHTYLNRILHTRPWLLTVDLFFSAGLLIASGTAQSPYYLYALSPVLAGAFFFQVRGGVLSAGLLSGLFLVGALSFPGLQETSIVSNVLITQIAGVWLTAVLFGYTSQLLERLHSVGSAQKSLSEDLSHQFDELTTANHQLKILHELTVLLQSAPDVNAVQQRVLEAVTGEMGFSRAVIGLVDPITGRLGGWRARPDNVPLPAEIQTLPLEPGSGVLAQAILTNEQKRYQNGVPFSPVESLNSLAVEGETLILPFWLREHPIGVLLVSLGETPENVSEEKITVLKLVASQAAVAIGTTMMCIDRARQLAIEQERNRIARDMHDTIAQSLFGFAFSLDACQEMLPENVEQVKTELGELVHTANQVRSQVRQSIFDLWPSSLTLERFQADLQSYASQCGQNRKFQVQFQASGDFERLPPALRRNLYRVTQEAVANTIHHAGVDKGQVTLTVEPHEIVLQILDDGKGFDPEKALARSYNREHFGLHGIAERIKAMGGECHFQSYPGKGTNILIQIPL